MAGVFWIGQTALFSWLDTRMRKAAEDGEEIVWMVHSGGFYRVEKLSSPARLPASLQWFKWEAAFTWVSGMLLLGLVYYLGEILVPFDGGLTPRQGMWLSLGILIVGWVGYDLLWIGPFRQRGKLGAVLSYGLAVLLAWWLSTLFSGRGAYIQIGATLGTIMTANVWMRILPYQRRMVDAVRAGEPFDPSLGEIAKQRSTHNTFLAIPLIFIMVSSHFPVTSYGHRLSWLILAGLIVVGFAARAALSRHEARG